MINRPAGRIARSGSARRARRIPLLLSLALVLLLVPAAAPALAGDWTVAEITGPAGTTDILPMAVNADGIVVGTARFAGRTNRTAFVWKDGAMSELALGGATSSNAYDINDRGTIVGYTIGASDSTGAIWSATTGALTPMAFNISGTYGSAAYAINEAGTISGNAGDVTHYTFSGQRREADNRYPALSSGGGWSRIPMPDIFTDSFVHIRGGYGTQINEDGMVLVANSPNAAGLTRISYGGGTATDPTLDIIPGTQGLNDLGQIAGRGPGSTSGPFTARVWSAATGYVEIGAAQALSRANAINNLGWVVGRVGTQDYQPEWRQLGNAWLWRLDGAPEPLAVLGPAGWSYANAMDVNDDGVIVGVGAHGGRPMGFMMTPSGLAHRLSGTVYGPIGAPAAGLQVRIVNPAGAQVATPVTGADGRYEATLPRGDYRVTVQPDGAYRPDELAGCRAIIGGSTCELGLVRNRVVDFYGIDVRVPGPSDVDRRGPDVRVPRPNRSVPVSRAGTVGVALGPFSEPVSGVVALQTAARGRASAAAARGRRRGRRGRARRARPIALGSKSFRAAAGRRVVVTIRLTRAARALLRRGGTIAATAVVTVRDALGNATVVRYALKLRAPRRRRRRR
jgi:probable HAF family extracellular repeat protein